MSSGESSLALYHEKGSRGQTSPSEGRGLDGRDDRAVGEIRGQPIGDQILCPTFWCQTPTQHFLCRMIFGCQTHTHWCQTPYILVSDTHKFTKKSKLTPSLLILLTEIKKKRGRPVGGAPSRTKGVIVMRGMREGRLTKIPPRLLLRG